jgi:hypothetical protein
MSGPACCVRLCRLWPGVAWERGWLEFPRRAGPLGWRLGVTQITLEPCPGMVGFATVWWLSHAPRRIPR